jgi:hypothetical protein
MAIVCEDLARYGVVLVPPATPEYFELLADIKLAISGRDTGRSAVLVNRAQVAIASTAFIWWFSGRNGRISPHSFLPGTSSSVILPFGLNGRIRKVYAFRNTIFPGSKRLMTCDGLSLGDNTDVRPPAEDEVWQGGFVTMGPGSRPDSDDSQPVKLTLDGVFFVDGGFAGPNCLGAWEQTTFAAEASLTCAALAQRARREGMPPAEFFVQVQTQTGHMDERMPIPLHPSFLEPPDPELISTYQLQLVGSRVFNIRKRLGDEAALAAIEGWADAPVPAFYKL